MRSDTKSAMTTASGALQRNTHDAGRARRAMIQSVAHKPAKKNIARKMNSGRTSSSGRARIATPTGSWSQRKTNTVSLSMIVLCGSAKERTNRRNS
jgi:hypothetical protein